jgi:Fur family transcriptional regulator, zinc uptake regulator
LYKCPAITVDYRLNGVVVWWNIATVSPPGGPAQAPALGLLAGGVENPSSPPPGKIALADQSNYLEILAREGRPLGAYDLIDRVAEVTGKRPAPISIYRALDFLLENRLVHRLASRNAYLACGHGHAREAPIAFLICEGCGDVVEADSGALRGSLAELASEAHFSPRAQVMEVTGLCQACAGV